jgi:SpoVK/Ycf46/Vps4 family AAA+-type ATPase
LKNLLNELLEFEGIDIKEVPSSAWDDIAAMEVEKGLIERKIVLPLMHPELAKKHGVNPPKAILLFGPPGTGKTFFAKGIAGKLGWTFIEISPAGLAVHGIDSGARQMRKIFEQLRKIEKALIFLDEFEELALHPEKTTMLERMLSNEMLRQLPKFRDKKEILIISATNNITFLNPALLRPGRFDYILSLGPPSKEARRGIFKKYLSNLNLGTVDLQVISEKTRGYTPADIQAVCTLVAQKAFETELSTGKDYKVTMGTLLEAISNYKPTLNEEDLKKFRREAREFCRVEGVFSLEIPSQEGS